MRAGYQCAMARIAIVALLVLIACSKPRRDRPDEAYKSFSAALRKGEVQAAWGALSGATQKAITAKAKEVAGASGGSVKEDPALMLFASGYKALPQGDVKVASED